MVTVSPWEDSTEMAVNPLRKVPFLITDEGQEVFDSRVICEYLDSQSESACFLPAVSAERLAVKVRDAMVEGAMDAILTIIMSKFVDPDMGDTTIWRQWLMSKANRVLEVLEKEIVGRDFQDISDITCYCFLDFWLFRLELLNEPDWRTNHPQLQAWFERMGERGSCKKTDPRNG
ncbi:Glutathione S-transferase family protein [uncultured Candidatus Thioglobus sp.]|nr:Glutathione S-transferase family protein [uncultured Candidatus Thioglobus sp.]